MAVSRSSRLDVASFGSYGVTGVNTTTFVQRKWKVQIYLISYPLGKNTPFDNLNKMSKPIFNWVKIDGVIYFCKHGVGQITSYIPNIEGTTINGNIDNLI